MNSTVKLTLGVVAAALIFGLVNAFFVVQMTQHAIVLRFGQVVREPISEPGLYFKWPFIENVVTIDKRTLDLDLPVQTVLSTDRQNLDVDAFARYRITQPLRFYQTVRAIPNANSRLGSFVNSSLRNVIAGATLNQLIRTDRDRLMNQIQEEVNREATTLGVQIIDLRRRRRARRSTPSPIPRRPPCWPCRWAWKPSPTSPWRGREPSSPRMRNRATCAYCWRVRWPR